MTKSSDGSGAPTTRQARGPGLVRAWLVRQRRVRSDSAAFWGAFSAGLFALAGVLLGLGLTLKRGKEGVFAEPWVDTALAIGAVGVLALTRLAIVYFRSGVAMMVSSSRIRVIVVDDQEVFRGGLVQLLEELGVDVVGDAGHAAEGIRQACELTPDVVLMDLNMPGMSGIEATQRLTAAAPLIRVLVLTVVSDEHSVTEALLAGACGYLLKDASMDQIIDGIQAARGESRISPRIAGHLVRRIRMPPMVESELPGSELTPRELEILELVARGMDNAEIARTLDLSQDIVKNHVSSILVNLQVANRIQAAVRAVRRRMV
jgi:DNA-binding NarL/FixJ family response regulator